MKITITFDCNFDNLGNILTDYQSTAETFWKIRKECGYRKDEEVWIDSAPRALRAAYNSMEKYEEALNTLWITSRKLYDAVAKTRRAAEKYMAMHNYERCLPNREIQRMMDAFMKEDA